jgi:hypothetical protein
LPQRRQISTESESVMARAGHRRQTVLAGLAFTCLAGVAPAHAQETGSAGPSETTATQPAPQWAGLPFVSLADYERLIPIGMSHRDLVRALGRPEAVMPGMGADEAYHYAYELSDGSTLRAVIIVRDGAVFIRRLYQSTGTGATSRVN